MITLTPSKIDSTTDSCPWVSGAAFEVRPRVDGLDKIHGVPRVGRRAALDLGVWRGCRVNGLQRPAAVGNVSINV